MMRVSCRVLLGVEELRPNPHKALELQRSFLQTTEVRQVETELGHFHTGAFVAVSVFGCCEWLSELEKAIYTLKNKAASRCHRNGTVP